MVDLIHDDDFVFWLPLELEKAQKDEKDKGKRWIHGVASTPDIDLQKELVEQNGIDFSYFLKYGYYNNDHKPGFENKVGQPIEAKIKKEGFWTRGFLWKNHKIADSIWELANALVSSQSDRQLGFSIQGKVLRRAGRRILKCWVQDVAVTTAPINTNTWLDIAKSLAEIPLDMWVTDESYDLSPRLVSPIDRQNCPTCRKDIQAKSMNSKLAIDESKLDLKKDDSSDNEDEEKALTASSPVAQVESLEGRISDLGWAHTDEKTKKSLESLLDQPLQFDECVELLHTYRQLSYPEAVVVTEAVFSMTPNSI